jgi:GMP synthase (glutamine-hydrolysing)
VLFVDNEVDPAYAYLPDALRDLLPEPEVRRPPAGDPLPGREAVADLDAVVLSGSTAGVSEADERPWIDAERRFVRALVDAGVPTLGVCFGHQLVNDALGGRVEQRESTAELVDVTFDGGEGCRDPLFDGVASTVPMVHGDHVVAPGDGLRPIARADYSPLLATRRADAPVWTTQYHPELTHALCDRIEADFGWRETGLSWDDVSTPRTVANFLDLAGVADARP